MAVEQPLHDPRRMLFGEVLRAEAPHRGDERGGVARQIEREAIGAPLEGARHRVRDRHHHERHAAAASSSSGRPATSATPAQAEPTRRGRSRPARRQVEARENQHALENDPLPDVAVHVMRESRARARPRFPRRSTRRASCPTRGCAACRPGRRARRSPSSSSRRAPTRTRRARARRRARRAPSSRTRSASRSSGLTV